MPHAFSAAFVALVVSTLFFPADVRGGLALTSPPQAYDAFSRSTNDMVRGEIFAWMRNKTLTADATSISDTLPRLKDMAQKLGRQDDFEAVCEETMRKGDPTMTAAAAEALSDLHYSRGENENALAVLKIALAPETGLSRTQTASLANKAAFVLCTRLYRFDEASSILSRAIETVSTNNMQSFVSLANADAAILLNNLSDPESAEARARSVLAFGDSCPGPAYSAASSMLSVVLAMRGDKTGAVEALLMSLRHPSVPSPGVASKLIALGAEATDMEEALRLLRESVASLAFSSIDAGQFSRAVELVQPETIELLLRLGKRGEAALECRALLFSVSNPGYKSAVELTARTLKAWDGNLGRANAFLEFQGADSTNHATRGNILMDYPALDDSVRRECSEALSAQPPPSSWNGWLLRSASLLWLDRPADAMDAALEAFAVCPFVEFSLQACAQAVVKPLLVATRDESLARIAVDHLLYGAPGRDGAAGTADDIPDPFPGIREKLLYGDGDVPVDLTEQPEP